jgi:hypothetical protein
MSALLNQKCRSRTGQPPMSDTAIRDHLDQVGDWRVDNGSIEKTSRSRISTRRSPS